MIVRERWRTRPIGDLLDAPIPAHQHQGQVPMRQYRDLSCGWSVVFFQRKGWRDVIGEVARRLRCQCRGRGPRLELVELTPETIRLLYPDDRESKSALRWCR